MPAHVYVTMMGQKSGQINGDSSVRGREGNIEVMQFDHGIHKPTDPHTGQPTGLRVHSPLVLWKAMDKSSPLLYQVLCTGETLNEVNIKLYETDPSGGEKQRFNIKLENAHVTEMKSFMPSTRDSEREHYAYHESVSIVYEKITWEDKANQTVATDDWTQRD
jgi:type VI secretion system secreted protein Hcp